MPLFPALGRPVLWTQGVHKTTKQTVNLEAGVWARSQSHYSDVAVSSRASTPPLWCRLWGGQSIHRPTTTPDFTQHCWDAWGCQRTRSDVSSLRIITRASGTASPAPIPGCLQDQGFMQREKWIISTLRNQWLLFLFHWIGKEESHVSQLFMQLGLSAATVTPHQKGSQVIG